MTDSSGTEERFLQRYKYLITLLLAVGVWLFLMFSPASWCEKISTKRWDLKGAWLFEGGQQDFLLVHMFSMGRHRGRSFSRFVTFDPADGRQLGEYLVDSHPKVLEVDAKLLWIREFGVGVSNHKQDVALQLPGLTRATDPPAFKRTVGVWDRKLCEGASQPPRMIGEKLLLDASFACDMRTGELIDLGEGDRLLAHQTLQDQKGKLLLSRYQTSGQLAWTRREADWCGEERGPKENGFRVDWSTWYQGRALLVLPEDDDTGKLFVLSIEPGSGQIVWKKRYD